MELPVSLYLYLIGLDFAKHLVHHGLGVRSIHIGERESKGPGATTLAVYVTETDGSVIVLIIIRLSGRSWGIAHGFATKSVDHGGAG